MKDLIEKILVYLPQYLTDFGSLLSGPKKFIAKTNTTSEESYVQALVFLGVSLVIVVIATKPFLLPGKDIWAHVATVAVGFLLGVSLYAVALRLAWRIVGGIASVRSFFVIYAYYFGVGMVLLALFNLLGDGIFKLLSPIYYETVLESWINRETINDFTGDTGLLVSIYVRISGVVFIFAWGIWGWGAYRVINGLSKARSAIAFFIAVAFAIPVILIANLVMNSMDRL